MADPLIFKDFNKGIGKSEFEGNGLIQNCDLGWRPGVVRIGYDSIKQTAGTVTALPKWIIGNEAVSGQQWAGDTDGNIYRGTALASWSKSFTLPLSTQSGIVWKNYLFATTAANLYAYGPLTGGSAVLYNFQSITTDSSYHPLLIGQDDIFYGGAGRYIFSIQEVSGQTFAAGTAATYSFNGQALDLPQDYRIRSLGELGKYLEIGSWKGANVNDFKVADIFPWDRTSDSFDLPSRFSENGVNALLGVNNVVYAAIGTEGKIVATDGSNVKELTRTPQQIIDLSGGGAINIPPTSFIFHNNKILFPASYYIFAYDLSSGALSVENIVSAGTANITLGGLLSVSRDQYLVGWSVSGGNKGIDLVGNSTRYSSYSAIVTSPYVVIGTVQKPRIISECELVLAKPLASGEGVRVSYRTDTSSAFTVIDTFDFATYGAIQNKVTSKNTNFEIPYGVQVRAELTTGASLSTSPELLAIILR